jgi:Domain of unknown function (DUF4261)
LQTFISAGQWPPPNFKLPGNLTFTKHFFQISIIFVPNNHASFMGLKSFFNRLVGNDKSASNKEEDLAESEDLDNAEPEVDVSKAFARTYSVELYFESRPTDLQGDTVHQGLKYLLGNVDRAGSQAPQGQASLHFFIRDHTAIFAQGQAMPAQICVFNGDKGVEEPVINNPNYAMAFGQCWDFPDAKEKLARCRHTVLVTDLMSSGLEHQERMHVFQRALYVIVKALQPVAIYWPHSQRWMDAQQYLQNVPDAADYDILHGPMHVRLFRIDNSADDDTVMDTLGLAALGLPDLQIHCHDLDVQALAGILNGAGHYIFERGDVIEDGNTLAGLQPDDRWVCRHEVALIQPDRLVLDINPGAPYAAGNRR